MLNVVPVRGGTKSQFPDIQTYTFPDTLFPIVLIDSSIKTSIFNFSNFLDFSLNYSITTTITTTRFFVELFCIDAGKSIIDY